LENKRVFHAILPELDLGRTASMRFVLAYAVRSALRHWREKSWRRWSNPVPK